MPRPSSPIAETLDALSAVFAELDLGWYVFGAQAAIVHGSSRVTKDVDVTVDASSIAPKELIDALARRGLSARVPDPEMLATTARVLPLLHETSGTPVDVVLAGPGLEARFLARAERRDVAGVMVPVAAAEDLVAMKILAGRPHDHEDALAILRAGDLALDRVRETLAVLEEALAEDDLVPSFERLVAKARRSGRR